MATRHERSGTLLFDGDCGFCTAAAERMRRWGRGRVEVVPWQRADLASLGVTRENAASSIQWSDGRRAVGGARAFSAALVASGGAWRIVGTVIAWPVVRVLAQWVYGVVSRNRYRLPGSTPACRLDP